MLILIDCIAVFDTIFYVPDCDRVEDLVVLAAVGVVGDSASLLTLALQNKAARVRALLRLEGQLDLLLYKQVLLTGVVRATLVLARGTASVGGRLLLCHNLVFLQIVDFCGQLELHFVFVHGL